MRFLVSNSCIQASDFFCGGFGDAFSSGPRSRRQPSLMLPPQQRCRKARLLPQRDGSAPPAEAAAREANRRRRAAAHALRHAARGVRAVSRQ
jgi:hypothetical protein